ncbi:uncharacterized protein LOC119729552 isoform X2 [Patiria miniata]|uniref:Uncharacterized protein n=1 Tax=Patiria miniata TaxID=46514 RepID=A0A914A2L4_PATMI|nr:uncharacterized protein LOC119729552 isoform X2 [Patiria miniata]
MEEAEVIDIDDLLGSSTPVQDAEEYDFENFPNEGGTPLDPDPTKLASRSQSHNSTSVQGGHKQRNATSGSNQSKQGPRKSSLEEDFKKLLLSSKSSKNKSQELEPSRGRNNNNVTWEKDPRETEGFSDAKVAQNEALLDAFVQGESSDAVLSDEELCIDVNSEELMQFILAFEANGEGNGDKPNDISTCATAKQSIAVNHVQCPSEDQESLNSSISTTESRDGSLTSSLASSDLSPIRTKQKVPRGKSVRFLMSNLLRNNKAQHHLTSRASGSDEDNKDAKRTLTRLKDRNKKRDKEDRDRERIAKQQAKILKTQMSSASSSSKTVAETSLQQQRDRVPDNNAQPRGQMSSVAVATPLSPGARDNTLHKQLIQAAARGDRQVLEFLLAANEGLSEVRDNRGNTLLHAVARRGHVDCLAWLAAGPCAGMLSVENDDCFTAAALAVKHGQVDCVKCLAELPGSASELHTQDHRWSLLHLAARFGQETCLRWLLEHMQMQDITLDQTDHSNNSPAHLAAKYGHLSCLQTLVEFNSDVTLLNKKKQSPCTLATRYHHHPCAQYLVVVETCIKLSNELTVTQRKLRESQQEKDVLAKKLREAMSCTDALVHTQKTDLTQRIEQIQGEYVDLTNLLVRQLDQMHRHQTDAGNQSGSTTSRDDLLVSKQKADQLEQACSELLELDQRQELEANRDQLQEIERRLSRLQPLPTSPIWPAPPTELRTGLALDSMRARLSEVNQQISTLHHPSPSLASDNLDTLSLSSSYTSSLSSSSSSLQTGVVQSSPGHSAKKCKTSWNEELSPRGMSANEGKMETAQPVTQNSLLGSKPSDPLRDTQDQRFSLPHSLDFQTKDNPSVQYMTGGITGSRNDGKNPKLPQSKANVHHVQASIEYSEPLQQGLSVKSTVEKTLHEQFRSSGDSARIVTSPPSYEQFCSKHSKSSLRVESSIGAEDKAKKPDTVLRNQDEEPHCMDKTDPNTSQDRTVPLGWEQQGSPMPYLLPTFEKLPQISDNLHQISAKLYSQNPKHCQQALPGFMRKVQPTNEFGEPESGKVIVKISNREELELLPSPATSKTQELSAHQRVGSNSSVSSLSSDIPWSESDADESPRPVRQPPRGGILSKKSQTKKSQEKHITFALDNKEAKSDPVAPSTNAKPPLNKRRDLSPIYEAPDLVKSTKDDSKSQKKDTQKSDKREASSREADAKKSKDSMSPDDKSPLGGRNFRLFSYSSDEGDHEGSDSHKMRKAIPQHEEENSSFPKDLTDIVSMEFNGIDSNGETSSRCKDDSQEKLWYESSDDEDDPNDNLPFHAESSSGFERHICYL